MLSLDEDKWLQLCSSMDVIDDAQTAIDAYATVAPQSDERMGERYLCLYGLFQAFVIQQDAFRHAAEVFSYSFDPSSNSKLERIRDLRNSVAGHPTKQSRPKPTRYTFVNRGELTRDRLIVNRARQAPGGEWLSIDLVDLMDDQQIALRQEIRSLIANVREGVDLQRKEHEGTVSRTYLDDLGYYFEKVKVPHLSGIDLRRPALGVIKDQIGNFEQFIVNRDGPLGAYPYLELELGRARYCIEHLDRYWSGDETAHVRHDEIARIVAEALETSIDELRSLADDMDSIYPMTGTDT